MGLLTWLFGGSKQQKNHEDIRLAEEESVATLELNVAQESQSSEEVIFVSPVPVEVASRPVSTLTTEAVEQRPSAVSLSLAQPYQRAKQVRSNQQWWDDYIEEAPSPNHDPCPEHKRIKAIKAESRVKPYEVFPPKKKRRVHTSR